MKHCINWNNAILYILFWWITRSKNKLLNLHSVQIEKGNIALVLQNEMILISNVQYIESIWLWLISVGTTKINFQNIFVFFLLSRWELFSLSFCLMLVQFVPFFHPPFFWGGGGRGPFLLLSRRPTLPQLSNPLTLYIHNRLSNQLLNHHVSIWYLKNEKYLCD